MSTDAVIDALIESHKDTLIFQEGWQTSEGQQRIADLNKVHEGCIERYVPHATEVLRVPHWNVGRWVVVFMEYRRAYEGAPIVTRAHRYDGLKWHIGPWSGPVVGPSDWR